MDNILKVVAYIERSKPISMKNLNKVCRALDTTTNYVFELREEK